MNRQTICALRAEQRAMIAYAKRRQRQEDRRRFKRILASPNFRQALYGCLNLRRSTLPTVRDVR